jgi:hypothetical protein
VRLPFLSGFPAIFQVFFAFFTSFPQTGHLAIAIPLMHGYHAHVHKTLAVHTNKPTKNKAKLSFFRQKHVACMGKTIIYHLKIAFAASK